MEVVPPPFHTGLAKSLRCVLFFKELLAPSISSTCLRDFYQCFKHTPKISFLSSFSTMGVKGRGAGGQEEGH